MALLFSMLRVPDPLRDAHQRDRQLRKSIKRLVNHFRELGNVRFYDEQGLCDQLYTHLAQALNRSLFAIGIDNTLPEEFARLYPRLVRTTARRWLDLKVNTASIFLMRKAVWSR